MNILMFKFMSMLEISGYLFCDCDISVIELYQVGKMFVFGMVVGIVELFGVWLVDICFVCDLVVQCGEFGICDDQFGCYVFYWICIDDGVCSLQFELCVFGDMFYVDGVLCIVEVVCWYDFEYCCYLIVEFICNGWLQLWWVCVVWFFMVWVVCLC